MAIVIVQVYFGDFGDCFKLERIIFSLLRGDVGIVVGVQESSASHIDRKISELFLICFEVKVL
jgi:hypothetical protein